MRPASRALVALAALAALAAVVAANATACVQPEHHKQPEACKAAIDCYFGAHKLAKEVQGFSGFDDTALFVNAYGDKGTCWTGDLALAHSCEERCRALMWQDCNVPYNFDAANQDTPFCPRACDFPEACIVENGNRSVCPGGDVDAGTEILASNCALDDVPEVDPPATVKVGCCHLSSRGEPGVGLPADGDCTYEYDLNVDGGITDPDQAASQ